MNISSHVIAQSSSEYIDCRGISSIGFLIDILFICRIPFNLEETRKADSFPINTPLIPYYN